MACLIELHAHTSSSSPCSRMSTGELIEAAILAGLDGVAITEHLVIEGALYAQELTRHKCGFPLFYGVKAKTTIRDAHSARQVGWAATWFPDKITTTAELVSAVKQGSYRAVNRKRQMI